MKFKNNKIMAKEYELPGTIRKELPKMNKIIKEKLDELYKNYSDKIDSEYYKSSSDKLFNEDHSETHANEITKLSNNRFEAMIQITGHFKNNNKSESEKNFRSMMIDAHKELVPVFKKQFDMELSIDDFKEHGEEGFDVYTTSDTAKAIWNFLHREKDKNKKMTESVEDYDVKTDEKGAIEALRAVAGEMIAKMENKSYRINQYGANIFANVITKNLLNKWTNGFKSLKIVLSDYQSFNSFEFIPPKLSQDFIGRFINGRETLSGFLHKDSEIKVKMSPRVFHTMKQPNDAINFFKSALEYYDKKVEESASKMLGEVMQLDGNMKHLIATTKLSGLVSLPMSLLFYFDDVDMSSKDPFKVSEKEYKAVVSFIKNITSRYKAPEKEKKSMLEDIKEIVKTLRERCDYNENTKTYQTLFEEVEKLYSGSYSDLILENCKSFIENSLDKTIITHPQTKILYEFFGVKRLKKLPRDIVTYITIEAENIQSSNDKMMIASYCVSKIEITEWYIALLDSESKKYIVPHDRPYLEWMRTALMSCYKKIMNTKISNPKDRPIIDIQYPKGYEG